MVWSPDAVADKYHDVPQRYCFTMISHYLKALLAGYTEVKYQYNVLYTWYTLPINLTIY